MLNSHCGSTSCFFFLLPLPFLLPHDQLSLVAFLSIVSAALLSTRLVNGWRLVAVVSVSCWSGSGSQRHTFSSNRVTSMTWMSCAIHLTVSWLLPVVTMEKYVCSLLSITLCTVCTKGYAFGHIVCVCVCVCVCLCVCVCDQKTSADAFTD